MESKILNANDAFLLDSSDYMLECPKITRFPYICRICLDSFKKVGKKSIVFEHEYNISLNSLVKEYCKIQNPVEYDGLPQHICSKCINFLIEMHIFRSRCHKNDYILRTVLDEHVRELKGDEINVRPTETQENCSKFEKLAVEVARSEIIEKKTSAEKSKSKSSIVISTDPNKDAQPITTTLTQIVQSYQDFYKQLNILMTSKSTLEMSANALPIKSIPNKEDDGLDKNPPHYNRNEHNYGRHENQQQPGASNLRASTINNGTSGRYATKGTGNFEGNNEDDSDLMMKESANKEMKRRKLDTVNET